MATFAPARTPHPRHSPACHLRKAPPPRWCTSGRRRVSTSQASASDQQSLPTARVESHRLRPFSDRTDYTIPEPSPDPETWRAYQACNAVQISQGVGRSEIPPALFLLVSSAQTRSERPFDGTYRGNRGDEAKRRTAAVFARVPGAAHVWHNGDGGHARPERASAKRPCVEQPMAFPAQEENRTAGTSSSKAGFRAAAEKLVVPRQPNGDLGESCVQCF